MSLYLEHFNLRELPFRITPAVEFFYHDCVRGETLAGLKYAITNGEGIISVIGEVGTGKSMLCRTLMTDLANEVELVYIANPTFSDMEIVFHIAEELGIDISTDRHQMTRALQQQLLDLHAKGKRILVCIDEAQAMPDSSLEQIRLLSNLETSTEKIVQVILFGQTELSDKLNQRHMRQLRERITSSFNLRNFNLTEVSDYIKHRLKTASFDEKADRIFSDGAIKTIAKVSQGISRRINILSDKAMLAAFAENSPEVTFSHAKQAARDARYRNMGEETVVALPNASNPKNKAIFAGVALLIAIIAISYQQASNTGANANTQPQAKPVAVTQPQPQPQVTATVTVSSPQEQKFEPVQPAVKNEPKEIALIDNPRWHALPPSSYIRQRLNATETQFRRLEDVGNYTARILTAPEDRVIEIERYLRDLARFFDIRNVMIYPSLAESEQLYVITYGLYPSEFQAELFIHELPSFFRSNKPFTQAIAVSQLEAASHW